MKLVAAPAHDNGVWVGWRMTRVIHVCLLRMMLLSLPQPCVSLVLRRDDRRPQGTERLTLRWTRHRVKDRK